MQACLKQLEQRTEDNAEGEEDVFLTFSETVSLEKNSTVSLSHPLRLTLPTGITAGTDLSSTLKQFELKDVLIELSLWNDAKTVMYGKSSVPLSFCLSRPKRRLMIFDEVSELVVKNSVALPTFINVAVRGLSRKPRPSSPPSQSYSKHVFMITRGTRGDVQPFVALARGLASLYGYKVTILTELRFQGFVHSQSDVPQGKISFRPIGGDAQNTVDSALGKWAISLESDVMNTIMLSLVSLLAAIACLHV